MIDTLSLHSLMQAINLLRTTTGNAELQVQTALTFLYIAMRHPNEVPYGEFEQRLGLSQASTSRNAAYLAEGCRGRPGYQLIEVYADPYYLKRKLCRLTPKGIRLAEELAAVLQKPYALKAA